LGSFGRPNFFINLYHKIVHDEIFVSVGFRELLQQEEEGHEGQEEAQVPTEFKMAKVPFLGIFAFLNGMQGRGKGNACGGWCIFDEIYWSGIKTS